MIDRELLEGDLSERYSLGLYAGPRGTATVVLRVPNELERQRGTLSGAVVTGLGPYDGAMSLAHLTEAVRTGVLRYLLQMIDVLGKTDREVSLATLLLGYNSSANLTVGASVEALVRGVIDANAKFNETTRLNIRVAQARDRRAVPRHRHHRRLRVAPGWQAGSHCWPSSRARTWCAARSWSRATACASACSTAATRATGRDSS